MDGLRLTLLLLGLALIAGIYLWDLRARRNRSSTAQDDSLDFDHPDDVGPARPRRDLEPSSPSDLFEDGGAGSGWPDWESARSNDESSHRSDDDFAAVGEPRPAPARGSEPGFADRADALGELEPITVAREEREREALEGLDFIVPGGRGGDRVEGERHVPSRPGATPASARPDVSGEALIIALTVMAKSGRRFSGHALRCVLEEHGFRYGAMSIFHLQPEPELPSDLLELSVANVLKPGTFDPETMDEIATPGIALFMRLEGNSNGAQSFERMLGIARAIAAALDGDLRDESRSTLTQQAVNHLRERVSEFTRRQRLSR